jgi:chemotaxis response regulator CheB
MSENRKIRVLVVDDSAFMRKAISMMIGDDPQIEVHGCQRGRRAAASS